MIVLASRSRTPIEEWEDSIANPSHVRIVYDETMVLTSLQAALELGEEGSSQGIRTAEGAIRKMKDSSIYYHVQSKPKEVEGKLLVKGNEVGFSKNNVSKADEIKKGKGWIALKSGDHVYVIYSEWEETNFVRGEEANIEVLWKQFSQNP